MMKKILITFVFLLFSLPLAAEEIEAPTFTIADEHGNEISLPRKHDGVDIYLFWASWCPYCKALMPHLQSILDEYGDDVRVYALNIKDDEDPRIYLDNSGYDFVLLPDADSVMEAYGVKGTPGLFIVDGTGKIHFNLYEMIFTDNEAYKQLKNSQKAARRAPAWAAEIRRVIDEVLGQ
ncbi:MAG: cytochrome c biogenesis protein CcmG/thiol:disulfide interchange protein DsbE [Lysobacterales bacterium]|jgi:cytochrome c biogenesis protein CcmG/thiol:disulfide interchange protein DsbE